MNPFSNLQEGNPPGVDAPVGAHPHYRWNSERAASSLPIENYKSNVDDFDAWIEKFESAVALATNPATEARKEELCLKWLPLKLDDEALAVLEQVPAQASYHETITSLKSLLIDPVEQYKWRAMKTQIKWDGKESFQALATRVKRHVDKYEKHLSAEDRIWAYFFRFSIALPDDYQEHIDITIPETARTIENAKDLALRIQMRRQGKEKKVGFTGAVYKDDRSMATFAPGMENLVTGIGNLTVNECHPNQDDYNHPPSWDDGYQASGGGYDSGYGRKDHGYQYQQGPFIHSNPHYNDPTPQYNAPIPQYSAPIPHYDAPIPQYSAPIPHYNAPIPQHNAQNSPYNTSNVVSYGPDMQYNAFGVKPWGSCDDQSGRGNSNQRRRPHPQSRGRSSTSGGIDCGYTNRPPGSTRRDIFKAIAAADEGDLSDVDDATLNAYLESIQKVQAKRASKRARYHQGN